MEQTYAFIHGRSIHILEDTTCIQGIRRFRNGKCQLALLVQSTLRIKDKTYRCDTVVNLPLVAIQAEDSPG